MALERKWLAIEARPLTVNGTAFGGIEIADTAGYRTKMIVSLISDSLQPTQYQVKEVVSPTQMILGLKSPEVGRNAGISLVQWLVSDNAQIRASEQDKNNIPEKDHYQAVYEADPVVADRVISVDEHGQFYNADNRLPVDAEISVVVPPLTVELDALEPPTQADPDNVLIAGSEDGTKTGLKHAVRVDSELDLRVGISDGSNKAIVDSDGDLHVHDTDVLAELASINLGIPAALGANTSANSMPVTIASDQAPIPVEMTFPDEPLKISGTIDGSPGGTEYGFVNNLRLQILDSHDRIAGFTYADFGTKNQRVTVIDYTSATFPGSTIRRQFAYTLVGTNYRRDNETWTIV